ncbi:MAG: hypothetical protein BSOLF_2566 [Candidatus Carbobacillus altaicus]|uniref:Uncharacterized protein n=1 Tax=Candidatus Carbonibacillus altaicus TaxID=2163959 RepID=A0A2R6Y2H8_9BACL|nr:MAG: hypothetical protein BSOLF_2566 [Candidatus Carbobacillus altaicus]
MNTQGATGQGPSFGSAQTEGLAPSEGIGLLQRMLERENMLQALRHVEANRGSIA